MGMHDEQSSLRFVRRRDLRVQRAVGAENSPSLASLFAGSAAAQLRETEVAAERPPTILVVCTGNICRSPLTELMLRARLGALGVRVHSAGTKAAVGRGMPREARRVAREWGVDESDASAHRARALTDDMVAHADLTLTMTIDQRTEVIGRSPGALRRVFTVREFAALAKTLEPQGRTAAASPRVRLDRLVSRIAARRGAVPTGPDLDDVIDPYGGSAHVYDESARQLAPAIDEVARVVRAAMSPGTAAIADR